MHRHIKRLIFSVWIFTMLASGQNLYAGKYYHNETDKPVATVQTDEYESKEGFGYLSVRSSSDSKGAEVFIDGISIGKLPVSQFPLKAGIYNLKIQQELYQPYFETVAITEGETSTIVPILRPNYSMYEIIVDGDDEAQIYDNGKLLGKGQWRGRLEVGPHEIEAKKMSHVTVSQKIEVEKDFPRKLVLSRPLPIYGALEISTTPSNATVIIDGERVGQTDYLNSNIVIGPHHVVIEMKGFKTEEFDITLVEGQTERINKRLTGYCDATIYSDPEASVYINGSYMGHTPYRINKTEGDYSIELSTHGYAPYLKTLHLDGYTQDMYINLHRNFIRENEFYLQAGYNFMPFSGISFGIGGYVKNINAEFNYVIGLSQSKKIYWNDKAGEGIPFVAYYKPSGGNFKAGYGVKINHRMRLTPQAGFHFVILSEKIDGGALYDTPGLHADYTRGTAKGAKAGSVSIGAKFRVAILPCLGVSIAPEYLLCISKSNGFEALSGVSKQIKGYAEGFGCNISINLFF